MLSRSLFNRVVRNMSNAKPLSYSAAAAANTGKDSEIKTRNDHQKHFNEPQKSQQRPTSIKRSPSPSRRPRTPSGEETVYVLTLLTDKRLHNRMTALRNQYFPKNINKLAAHLTLFHALPASKLETSIIPLLKEVSAKTPPFAIKAEKPFRLNKGFAVSISGRIGGFKAMEIHQDLQTVWNQEEFLSEQDAGGCRLHYTLMNKVDDEVEISSAYNELLDSWRAETGTAEGLALWRYDRGFWRWDRAFSFGESS